MESKSIGKDLKLCLTQSLFFSDALNELGVYANCMYKALRKLKRNSTMVNDILKTLINLPSVDAVSR